MHNIADGVYFDHNGDKEIKMINSKSFNERNETGNFDKDNIFELLGFC